MDRIWSKSGSSKAKGTLNLMLMLAWVIKEALYNEMEAAVAKTKIGNVTC